jgi:hypothetical protein
VPRFSLAVRKPAADGTLLRCPGAVVPWRLPAPVRAARRKLRMQGLHTHTAMRHADLSILLVWDHFLNMGGSIEQLEVDAYLHGLMALPEDDRDCVTQAVNELLDDLAMLGHEACCRAPYSTRDTFGHPGGAPAFRACAATDRTPSVLVAVVADGSTGTGARPKQRPSPLRPVRRAARRER